MPAWASQLVDEAATIDLRPGYVAVASWSNCDGPFPPEFPTYAPRGQLAFPRGRLHLYKVVPSRGRARCLAVRRGFFPGPLRAETRQCAYPL
jgi:hypothetical protein